MYVGASAAGLVVCVSVVGKSLGVAAASGSMVKISRTARARAMMRLGVVCFFILGAS